VLFVNGIPLAVVQYRKGGPTCTDPMREAFVQLQRYMNQRVDHELPVAGFMRSPASRCQSKS